METLARRSPDRQPRPWWAVAEWELYRAIAEAWRSRGFHVLTSVTDPGGSRVELDVVAFTPELEDVRVTEAKVEASKALVDQCVDRLRYAERVYAAAPAASASRLLALARGDPAANLGVIAVDGEDVEVLREAEATPERREPGKAHVIERQLRAGLAEGEADGPTG